MNRVIQLRLLPLLVLALRAAVSCSAADATAQAKQPFKPKPDPAGQWVLVEALSDEFEGDTLDKEKWDHNPDDWGVWSWEPENAFVKGGDLHIRTQNAPHQRSKMDLFYTSGIVKSRAAVTYGYFEARIKGASKFPGVCPAFWMIGNRDGESSEIDFMEIQEVNGNIRQVDCNLHARVRKDGELTWVRQRRHWIAPWDPRDDYHVYACESDEKTIAWYIDGVQVLSGPNEHWHLPMNVILSMGLRTPLRLHGGKHGDGNQTFPNPKASTPGGFPTTMLVDYVRLWRRNGE